jgi:tripartite-type tricarboxylate transporter receptor subunit TctC
VRQKTLFLLVAFLLISIMIVSCTSIQSSNAITPKVEKYPNKPITLIVPYSAGGGLDLVARAIEKRSVKYFGQPINVINKPGGSGILGWNELVGATPDGYTLGMVSSDMLLPPLYNMTKYDYVTALNPLAQVISIPIVIAVRSDQPWKNIDDLVDYARKHPGKLKFGNAGVGSMPHIVGEMFAHNSGIKIEQVPFRGASESTAALLGGHIQVAVASQTIFNEYIKDGMIRILATTGAQRLNDPTWKEIPTFKEQGFNILFSNQFGIAAPKEIPIEVKNKLVEELKAMVADPGFQKDLVNMGLQVRYLPPDKTQNSWLSDSQELDQIVQETGIIDLINSQKQ